MKNQWTTVIALILCSKYVNFFLWIIDLHGNESFNSYQGIAHSTTNMRVPFYLFNFIKIMFLQILNLLGWKHTFLGWKQFYPH